MQASEHTIFLNNICHSWLFQAQWWYNSKGKKKREKISVLNPIEDVWPWTTTQLAISSSMVIQLKLSLCYKNKPFSSIVCGYPPSNTKVNSATTLVATVEEVIQRRVSMD